MKIEKSLAKVLTERIDNPTIIKLRNCLVKAVYGTPTNAPDIVELVTELDKILVGPYVRRT